MTMTRHIDPGTPEWFDVMTLGRIGQAAPLTPEETLKLRTLWWARGRDDRLVDETDFTFPMVD